MIFKKAIPRRTFLRGMGATLGLPLLEAMVPAMAAVGASVAKPVARLSFVYVPNGIIMDQWTPATEGTEFELTPILKPLAPFQDQLLVLSGLAHVNARRLPDEAGGDHGRAGATYLTGLHPRRSEGADIQAGISVDQIIAKELGKHTQLASLEVGIEPTQLVGACESGYSCAYFNTISWRSPTTPVPMESQPRAVFERLFGDSDSTDPSERLARIKKSRSILDWVTEEANRFLNKIGPADRAKVSEYLEAIRDVERRIQIAEEQNARELPRLERPTAFPSRFDERAKLMFDLQVLAFQSDMTRVITTMVGREQSGQAYPEIGVGDAHHALTHHIGDVKKIAKVSQINLHHVTTLGYYLEKLGATPDGDGSLLDSLIVVYGSGISDGNLHSHDNLPALMVGGRVNRLKGGRHIRYPDNTPMSNLHLTITEMMGLPVEQFGDSTGRLELLPV
jgi:hypothetical protein